MKNGNSSESPSTSQSFGTKFGASGGIEFHAGKGNGTFSHYDDDNVCFLKNKPKTVLVSSKLNAIFFFWF